MAGNAEVTRMTQDYITSAEHSHHESGHVRDARNGLTSDSRCRRPCERRTAAGTGVHVQGKQLHLVHTYSF